MPGMATDAVWRRRLMELEPQVESIDLPEGADEVDQDEEWCEIIANGKRRKLRFHDYDQIFEVPGLYEKLFYEQLECCSPSYVVNLLDDVAREFGDRPERFRVLDVGAGNGMVGDELQNLNVESVVGVDIIPAAKTATLRDRAEVYDGYHVTDLTELPEMVEEQLRRSDLNCLTTVAALGFGDIPPAAFAKALDLIDTPGWLAFNLKEDFLDDVESNGFSHLIRELSYRKYLRIYCTRRYQHRVSMTGKPLFYVAMVARKLKDLDSELLESLLDDPRVEK